MESPTLIKRVRVLASKQDGIFEQKLSVLER